MAFYLHRDGQTVPFELETLRGMARGGDLRQDEYIYVEAKGEWIGAALVEEMAGAWNIEESEATVAMEIPPEFFAGLDEEAAAPEPAPASAAPSPPPAAPAPMPEPAPAAAPMPAPAPMPAAPAPAAPAPNFGARAPASPSFGSAPQASSRPSASRTASSNRVRSYEEAAQSSPDIDMIGCIKEAWEISKDHLLLLIGGALVLGLISMAAGMIPLASFFVGVPIFAGITIVNLRLVNGSGFEFSNFFDGFKRFMPLMIVGLIIQLGVFLGILLLLLPGIYFAIATTFAVTMVIDRQEEPMAAIKGSMAVVNGNFLKVFLFMLVLGVFNFIGLLACGVGGLITGPVSGVAMVVFYNKLLGIAGGAEQIA
jgi:hypothetical protein